MNPTITIDDTDEEVIDLDSSQDAINVTDNAQSECSIKNHSLSNDNANKMDLINANEENNKSRFNSEICDTSNTLRPLFKVIFRDESVSRQYSKRIKEFLEKLVDSKTKNQESDSGLTLEVWNNDNDSTSQSVEITTESEDSQDIICDTLFTVDTQPKLNDDFDVPTYGKKYQNMFDNTKVESDSKKRNDGAPRLFCFNCLENHNLRDCTNPRDYDAIEKNRKIFNQRSTKTLRYHLGDDQRFGHIIPGQLSNNLRKALGLKNNELPRHIYRMRVLGYPPGWLEEAHLQHSGLSLFNSDGVAEGNPNDELGAIYEEGDRDQYDIKKIYDFPGFNVPPPPGTRDEENEYWLSRWQTVNSKQTMLLMLNGKKADEGYKRKRLKISNNVGEDKPATESSEMEIEDAEGSVIECVPVKELFVPPLPQEFVAKPPEPPPSQTVPEDLGYHSQEIQFFESPICDNSKSPASRMNSPSLTELENMKKQLLVELQKSNSNSDVSVKSNFNTMTKSKMPPPSNEGTPESKRIDCNEANTSCGSIKSLDLGTPVLQSTSPYSKLPSSEKFSKNICGLMNFENLPDSTGKYEQMTGVLQKVRTTLAKLHHE